MSCTIYIYLPYLPFSDWSASFNRSKCTRETSGRFLLLDLLAKKVHVCLWCTFASSGVKKEWSNIAKHGFKWPSKYWISCRYVLVWKHCWYNDSTPAEMSWNTLKFEQIKRKTGRTRPHKATFYIMISLSFCNMTFNFHPIFDIPTVPTSLRFLRDSRPFSGFQVKSPHVREHGDLRLQ